MRMRVKVILCVICLCLFSVSTAYSSETVRYLPLAKCMLPEAKALKMDKLRDSPELVAPDSPPAKSGQWHKRVFDSAPAPKRIE